MHLLKHCPPALPIHRPLKSQIFSKAPSTRNPVGHRNTHWLPGRLLIRSPSPTFSSGRLHSRYPWGGGNNGGHETTSTFASSARVAFINGRLTKSNKTHSSFYRNTMIQLTRFEIMLTNEHPFCKLKDLPNQPLATRIGSI